MQPGVDVDLHVSIYNFLDLNFIRYSLVGFS